MVVTLLMLLSYSCMAGSVEAILYSKKAGEAFTWNEHVLFVGKMVVIGIMLLWPYPVLYYDVVASVCFWILAHPFFHDGFYYETRNRIDVPEYHFWYDFSKTSTARFEIRFIWRCVMLSAGVAGLVIYQIVK